MNVATKWGLTKKNYEQMVLLHNELADKGFEICAFPCNQFGGQEPGTPQEIHEFATKTHGAKFLLFEKIDVNG